MCGLSLSVDFCRGLVLVVVREVFFAGEFHLSLCLVAGGEGSTLTQHTIQLTAAHKMTDMLEALGMTTLPWGEQVM